MENKHTCTLITDKQTIGMFNRCQYEGLTHKQTNKQTKWCILFVYCVSLKIHKYSSAITLSQKWG